MTNNTSAKNGSAIYTTAGSGKTSSLTISGSYVTSHNEIYVASSSHATIYASGLDDLDNNHASNTWSNFVKGTVANVTYK